MTRFSPGTFWGKWNVVKSNHLELTPRPWTHQFCWGRRAGSVFPCAWQPHDLCQLHEPWYHNSCSVPTRCLPAWQFAWLKLQACLCLSPWPQSQAASMSWGWGVGSGDHIRALSPRNRTTRCFYHPCLPGSLVLSACPGTQGQTPLCAQTIVKSMLP